MFNTTVVSNRFNYNINAVSGTLRKSHPKSKITLQTLKDNLRVFDPEQPNIYTSAQYPHHRDIVVLQVMLCGDHQVLMEYVEKKDFEEGWGNNDQICKMFF